MAQEIWRQRYNFSVSDGRPETCLQSAARPAGKGELYMMKKLWIMSKKEKELLKKAYSCLSKQETSKLLGGENPGGGTPGGGSGGGEIPVGPGGGEIPVGPGGGGLTHSCTTLGSIDCFCEPHCISGISCTSGWY